MSIFRYNVIFYSRYDIIFSRCRKSAPSSLTSVPSKGSPVRVPTMAMWRRTRRLSQLPLTRWLWKRVSLASTWITLWWVTKCPDTNSTDAPSVKWCIESVNGYSKDTFHIRILINVLQWLHFAFRKMRVTRVLVSLRWMVSRSPLVMRREMVGMLCFTTGW